MKYPLHTYTFIVFHYLTVDITATSMPLMLGMYIVFVDIINNSQSKLKVLILSINFYNSKELGTGQSQNRDTIQYATSGGVSSLSIDAKKKDPLLCDDPMEDFEAEVQAKPRALPIPPKPKVKNSPKEPSITPSINPCYASSGHPGPRKPVLAKKHLPHTQIQGQIQQSRGRPPIPAYENLH